MYVCNLICLSQDLQASKILFDFVLTAFLILSTLYVRLSHKGVFSYLSKVCIF